jgi:hypothetical protein
VKILSKIILTAMVIGFALFFWSEKIFLMEKEQKVIVSDESKMEAIHEMEDMAREINCISTCYDDDVERSCHKRCQTESKKNKKRRENLKKIKERTTTYDPKISENERAVLIGEYFKRNGYLLKK